MFRFNPNEKTVPFVLLIAVILSFGLLIPWLGFFWDDWPVIFMAKTQGVRGFWDFYQYDRPYSAWTYILFSPILGTSPLPWHIFTLLLRWSTSVFLWAGLRTIWSRKPSQVLWVSILFAVCPIFTQQPVAVAYSQHWICYLLYAVSIYFMLKAHEKANRYFVFTALAVLSSLLNMITMEYFLGLELLRPVILWLYFLEREPRSSKPDLYRRTAKSAWFYFALLILYTIWRLFFLDIAGKNSHRLVVVSQFVENPVRALIDFSQLVMQDFLYLMSSWLAAVNPANIDLRRPFSVAALMVAFLSGAIFWIILNRYRNADEDEKEESFPARLIGVGVLAVLLGMLPVWLIGRQASVGMLGSRFTFAAMLGVSATIVGILEWLSSRTRAKLTVVAVLVTFAVHTNLLNAKSYQESWEKQRQFYWQLYWRAPDLQPHTALISEGEIFPFVGLYSTSMGIALLYPPADDPQDLPYWFFSYWEHLHKIPTDLVEGIALQDRLRNYSFSGQSRDSLIVEYDPGSNRCLQIFTAQDKGIKEIPEFFEGILSISNLDRIKPVPPGGKWVPPEDIFDPEPGHSWCYYYEKAELAGQYRDWDEVIRLMEEAERNGFTPLEAREYLPLLNARLMLNDFEEAQDLTIRIDRLSNNIGDSLCNTWLRQSETQNSSELNAAFEHLKGKLGCFD